MTDSSSLHPVLKTALDYEPGEGQAEIYLAGGCFWGLERIFWQTLGVVAVSVGYTGGQTQSPSYVGVCTGTTGHAETVRVVYDRNQVSDAEILAKFWENHDPTQLNRQGNDIGTQYRSAVWATDAQQLETAQRVRDAYNERIAQAGHGPIVTSVERFGPEQTYWPAEPYHQAYLFHNPGGYCNHGFNGVSCPTGLGV